MTTTLQVQDLKPGQLKPASTNPEGRTDDVDELAASIRAKGILEPLIVAPNGSGSSFALIAGHRRLAAAKQVKLKTVPCIVREDLTEPVEQLEAMLVENLHRTDLTPIEEAGAYQQLLAFPGYTVKRITETTGRAQATVRKRLSLTKLSTLVQRKIQSGQISLSDALALAEFADDPDLLARLENAIGGYQWEYTLRDARERRDRDRREKRLRTELTKRGLRLYDHADLSELDLISEQAGSDLPGYVYLGDDDEDLHVSVAEHASCAGHAAEISFGNAQYLCTEVEKHPELLEQVEDPETAEERATRHALIAERERVLAELNTAAKTRRAHLAKVLDEIDLDPGTAAAIISDRIVDHMRRGYHTKEVLADVLLVDRGDDEDLFERLRGKLASLSLPRLAMCLDIVEHAAEETTLERPAGWRPDTQGSKYEMKSTQGWRTRLQDVYGYSWSQPELDVTAPPAVVEAKLPASDVTPDQADAMTGAAEPVS